MVSTEKVHILIVDDRPENVQALHVILEELGEHIVHAGSGREALRCTIDQDFAVILLDVHMPGGGGVEVIGQVTKSRPQQRFLALSVSDDPQDVIAIVRAGARGYVTKTITGEELADAVRRVRDGDAVFSPRLAGFVLDAFAGELPAEEVEAVMAHELMHVKHRDILIGSVAAAIATARRTVARTASSRSRPVSAGSPNSDRSTADTTSISIPSAYACSYLASWLATCTTSTARRRPVGSARTARSVAR